MESVASPLQDESWSRLPEDVVLRVLARLPVAHLFRARTVCKDWTLLTATPEFLTLCNGQTWEPYFPVMMQGGKHVPTVVFGYDHMMGVWQKLPLVDFVPGEAVMAVAAAEGLVCFQTVCFRYFLSNPVARTCVELPRIAYQWTPLSSVHIVVDHCTGSYRVIMLGKVRHASSSESFQSVVIYESTMKAWRFRDAEHIGTYGRTSVVCGDILYCGALTRGSGECVMGYDIRTEAWQEGVYKIPPHPDDRGDYQLTQLVECGGDVYMALARGYGGVGSSGVVSSMNILKLEATTDHLEKSSQGLKAWREVTFLCDGLLEDLQKGWLDDDDSGAIVCVGYGCRICISAGIGFILMYDVETGCWSRLPSCPQLFNLSDDVIAEPFHFPVELRLSSRV